MNNSEQKPQLNIHDVSGSDFRVREYDGIFEIQRKEIKKVTTGFLWWKKTKEEINWKFVDKWGNCLWAIYSYTPVNNYHEKINSFTDLQSALDMIDVMIAGAKYHYRQPPVKKYEVSVCDCITSVNSEIEIKQNKCSYCHKMLKQTDL